jgi:hypothetical protein
MDAPVTSVSAKDKIAAEVPQKTEATRYPDIAAYRRYRSTNDLAGCMREQLHPTLVSVNSTRQQDSRHQLFCRVQFQVAQGPFVYILGREIEVLEPVCDFRRVLTCLPNTAAGDCASLSMPVRTEACVWDDQVAPVFQMNLPEGYLFSVLQRTVSSIATVRRCRADR